MIFVFPRFEFGLDDLFLESLFILSVSFDQPHDQNDYDGDKSTNDPVINIHALSIYGKRLSQFGDRPAFPAPGQVSSYRLIKYLEIKGLFQVAVKPKPLVFVVDLVVAAKGNNGQVRKMRLDPMRNL